MRSMNTRIAVALVLSVVGCKSKEAAPKQEPATAKTAPAGGDSPAAPPAAPPVDPAKAVVATDVDLEMSADCLGFTAGGTGAYVVTLSRDAMNKSIDLVALGAAEDPKLSGETEQFEEADAKKELAPALGKIKAFAAGKQLSPCVEWKSKGEIAGGKLGGADVKISLKGTKLTVAGGGKKFVKEIEEGAEYAGNMAAYSSSEGTGVVVVLNATAEAMSKWVAYWVAASDLK